MLEEVREQADVVIDTSDLSSRQLRERIKRRSHASSGSGIALQVISFGFNTAFRSRRISSSTCDSLENPFYRSRPTCPVWADEPVTEFVLGQPMPKVPGRRAGLLRVDPPGYEAEGHSRLTVAFGCTGGHHRSIAIAEESGGGMAWSGLWPRRRLEPRARAAR